MNVNKIRHSGKIGRQNLNDRQSFGGVKGVQKKGPPTPARTARKFKPSV